MPAIDATIDSTGSRKLEAAPLQPLIPERVPIAVPVKQFHHVTAAIAEDKEGTGKGISAQLGADHAAQSIEGLAHVARAKVEINAGGCGQRQHGYLP